MEIKIVYLEPANYIENEPKDSVFWIFDQSILSFSNENFIRPITQDEFTWSYMRKRKTFSRIFK